MEYKECIEASRTSSGSSTTMTKYCSFPIPPRYGHSPTHYPFQFPGMQRLPPYSYALSSDSESPTAAERSKETSIGTLLQCVDNLIGISIFMCPYASELVGSQFGALTLGLTALTFSYTASLLEKCQKTLGFDSYPEVLTYNKSPTSQNFIAVIVYAHALMNLFIYYVLIKSSILCSSFGLVENSDKVEQSLVDVFFSVIVTSFGVLVLLAEDKLKDKISYVINLVKMTTKFILCTTSIFSMAFIATTRLFSTDKSVDVDSDDKINDLNTRSVSGTLQGICIFCYGYLGHKMLPTIFSSAKHTTSFNHVICLAFIIVTCIYIVTTLLGTGLYPNEVKIIYLWNISPKTTWIHKAFIITLSIFITIKFFVEVNCFQGSVVEALDLKKALNIGRGRANSLDADHRIIKNRELTLSVLLYILVPLFITCIARVLDAAFSVFDHSGDSAMISYLVFVNGGIFGVTLCWLLPISAYMEIDQFGEYIPRHEYILLYSLTTVGVCLVAAVIVCCVIDFLSYTIL